LPIRGGKDCSQWQQFFVWSAEKKKQEWWALSLVFRRHRRGEGESWSGVVGPQWERGFRVGGIFSAEGRGGKKYACNPPEYFYGMLWGKKGEKEGKGSA